MHLCHGVPSSYGGMEHSGRLGRVLEYIPFYLYFAMKLLDPLTPMLIRGGAWGGGGANN